MNALLSGREPAVADHLLGVEHQRVLVDGRRAAAGDGVARALARMIDPSVGEDAPEGAITVDQTNTSVTVDERLVVKIVGEWRACDRSSRLLALLAEVDGVERLVGSIDWEHPGLGRSTVALVTEYLPGAVDGWTWAVDDVLAHLDGAPAPRWPGELGSRVAAVHAALAREAVPAPTSHEAHLRDRLRHVLDSAIGVARGETRQRLANRSEAIEAVMGAASSPSALIPLHGDLHVGQILRAGERWAIIDFDGDPQLPPAERDAPDAVARDVAHLRVSIDMVAAVAQKRLGRADARAAAWADAARLTFLESYESALARALPAMGVDRSAPPASSLFAAHQLPALEAEQLLRELLYAERFLPRWSYAADEAISRRFPARHTDTEVPWTPPPSGATSS